MAIVWLIIAAIMLVGEFICPIFFMFWFAIGALAALITTFITSNISIQIVVFLVVSIALTVFIKPLTNKLFKNNTKDELNMNGITGKQTLATEDIDNQKGTGKVKVNGEVWRAVNENDMEVIPKGSKVSVVKIDGVKLIVKLVAPDEN